MTSIHQPPLSDQARGPERFTQEARPEEGVSLGRALLALAALLALLVGVPLLLLALAGPPPVPTGFPDRHDLTRPLGSDLLVKVLLAVFWLAWLQFAVCAVVEIISFVKGGGLPRAVPLSGASQSVARMLVGTIMVGLSLLGTSGAASAATTEGPTQATTPHSALAQAGAATAQEPRQTEQIKHTTRVAAQASRVATTAPTAGVPSAMTEVIGHKVAIVKPPSGHYHDNLWDIAERHLGDGRRWKEIFELNQGRVQPDGQQLVLGRLIQPGWVLIMPNDAVGLDRVTEAPAQPGSATQADQSWLQSAADQVGDTRVTVGDTTKADSLARDLTEGGLLSAAVLGALLLERRRRRGTATSAAEDEAEVALRIGADLDRATWLDAALRSLSAACRGAGINLPPVYAAVLSETGVELQIAGVHQNAPEGWRVDGEGRTWVRDRGDALPAERGHAPYPGLVCLGRDDDGRDVLVDLESADGIVSVDGSFAIAREVVAAIAVQLATVPWADERLVLGHDLGEELAAIGQDRLQLVSDLDATLAELTSSAVQQPSSAVLSGRLGRSPGVTPRYLVLGSTVEDGYADQLAGLTPEGTRGLGIVTTGAVRASRWQATVDDGGRLTLPLLGLDVAAVRLGASSAEGLAGLFEHAGEEKPLGPSGRPRVPPGPAGDDAHWSTAAVRVGILGSLEVRTTGDIDEARLPLATELVTLLALQTEPVHPSVVGASIWPMGVTPEVRDATIARVRDWLGHDSFGNYLLGETDTGRLRLSVDVAVDWHAFCELVRRSRDAVPREEAELLRRALQLVRGKLLTGIPSRRYSWVARTGLERQARILVEDSAHRLVELSPSDPSGATAAVRAGLRLVPHSQLLWRDLLLAERDQGGRGLSRAAENMLTQLQSAGVPLEPESAALLDELLPTYGERHA